MELNLNTKNHTILIVEDDEILNAKLCAYLQENDFITQSAAGVKTAIDALRNNSAIDLVLLDFQLSDGIGMEVLQPDTQSTFVVRPPIIMISVDESPDYLETCFQSGVVDYIVKPINFSLLVLKIKALIKSMTLQRTVHEQKRELEKFKKDSEREENLAKFIYQYLLNQDSQKVPGLEIWLKSYSSFSGDIALVRSSPNGSLYFILADATGHGLSAAITIMPAVTIFNSMVAKGFHIQQIANEINKKLVSDTPADRFVAAILVEINPVKQEIIVWNGGMPSAYWVNQGEIVHEFSSMHMPLGILDGDMFDASVITARLPEDGFIFSYTDGLTEQVNSEGKPFGLQKIKDALTEKTRGNLLNQITEEFSSYTTDQKYSDDISICIMHPKEFFAQQKENVSNGKKPDSPTRSRYELTVKVSGAQLANCELPALCNQFLHYIGLDQQFCQRVFTVVAELVSNAIDHGVLQLDSQIKEQEDGFMIYFHERENKLTRLCENDSVELSLSWNYRSDNDYLIITVTDTGIGYDPKTFVDNPLNVSGRGLQLIRKIAHEVDVIPPGNATRVTLK